VVGLAYTLIPLGMQRLLAPVDSRRSLDVLCGVVKSCWECTLRSAKISAMFVEANCLRVPYMSVMSVSFRHLEAPLSNLPGWLPGVYDRSVKNEIILFTKKASNMTNPA